MWVTSSSATALTPTAIALGNFDGVHRGHQQVVQPILQVTGISQSFAVTQYQEAPKDHNLNKASHAYATVVTFNPHPREFFTGQSWKLLTPPEEKVKQLELLGVEQLVLLPFNREIASLSPQQFVEKILVQQLRASRISVGKDFRFGQKRAGTAADLQVIARDFGIEVTIASIQTCQGDRISSSLIRQALSTGEISRANQLLGRPYTLTGTVMTGQKLGRTIGFPTANLKLPVAKFLPRQGVYCVRVSLENSQFPIPNLQSPINGVMNLGCRPTVDGTTPTVEVHLLDWSGDLYGQTITVSLEKFLRSEQKFPSLDALKAQIAADCDTARAFLTRLLA